MRTVTPGGDRVTRALRPQYANPKACCFCGSLCVEIGTLERDNRDGRDYWTPEPIEHRTHENDVHGEERRTEGRTEVDRKSGMPKKHASRVYWVVPYTHVCERAMTMEDPRPECGALPGHALKPFHGELPEWVYATEGNAADKTNAALDALRETFGGAE